MINQNVVSIYEKYKTIIYSKYKNNIKDFSTGLLVKIAILLSQLLLVPIYLDTWGTELYGEWIMITTIPNYLLLSDLGLTITVSNEICKKLTLTETKKAIELFKATNSVLIIIGIFLLFLFILSKDLFSYKDFLNLTIVSKENLEQIIILYIINIIFSLFVNLNLGYFKALNKYYINQIFIFILYLFDFILTVICVKNKLDLISIPIALILNRIIILNISKYMLSKHNDYEFGFSGKLKIVKSLIPTSINYSLFTMGYALFLQGNTLIVGKKLGTTEVVVFNTIRTMVNSIKAFGGILYLPKMPTFTILLTKGENKKSIKLFWDLMKYVSIYIVITSLLIYIFHEEILNLWLNEKINIDQIFLISMLLSVAFQTLWNTESMVPLSINQNKGLAIFPILGIVNLIIQYVYIGRFGLNAMSISLMVLDIIMFLIVYSISMKILNKNKL